MMKSQSIAVRQLPRNVLALWMITSGLTAVCLLSEYVCYRLGYRDAQYVWPFIPFYGFIDFYCFGARFHFLHQAAFFSTASTHGLTFMYPAPVAMLYALCYRLPAHGIRYYLAFTFAALLLLEVPLGSAMRIRGVSRATTFLFLGSMTLLSYPLWFEYLLGNMEMVIFLIVASGLVAFLRGNYFLAAALFGVAASMKLFPLVYFGLLLARKQFREIFFGIGVAATSTLFSLWLICSSLKVAWAGISAGLKQFQIRYMLPVLNPETGFDHSLFALIKRFMHSVLHVTMTPLMVDVYLAIAASTGLWLFFRVIWRLPLLNQMLSLTVASILLPPTSHDYTLLHLYVPAALLLLFSIDAARAGRKIPGLTAAWVCIAVALAPESELIFHHASFGGQVKCIILIALFLVTLRYPFALQGSGTAIGARAESDGTGPHAFASAVS